MQFNELFFVGLTILSCIGLFVSALATLQHWEFRRLAKSRLAENIPTEDWRYNPVAVIAPIKGHDPRLEYNLKRLFDLDYPNYRIIFVVESEDDPSVGTIRKLIRHNKAVPSELVVAGVADQTGQKVHNLRCAVANLAADTQIFAFVDADTAPSRRWLKSLVCRLFVPGHGASSAIPWHVPERTTLANLLLYSITSSTIALLGRHAFNRVSGASWAIRQEIFERTGIFDAWKGTLSDDLVASHSLRRAGLNIEFEPAGMGVSRFDMNFTQMFRWLRRQFLTGRYYATGHWLLCLLAGGVIQTAFWGNVFVGCYLLASNGNWLSVPILCASVLYSLAVARGWLRQDASRRCLPQLEKELWPTWWFDTIVGPVAGLFGWFVLLSSIFGRWIHWKGVSYHLASAGNIRSVQRSNPVMATSKPAHRSRNVRALE